MTDISYITEIEGLRVAMERLGAVLDGPIKTGREYALAEAAYAKVFDSFCVAIFAERLGHCTGLRNFVPILH
jgi:hypothetical protein